LASDSVEVRGVIREIGGEFHLVSFPQDELVQWPRECSFFASGRAALGALCLQWEKGNPGTRLFVPEYFCRDVIRSLRACDVPIAFYTDDPCAGAPELEGLHASPGDMVMAVNFFGVRCGGQWAAWREANPRIALIEDHTHDPHSAWARSSNADFAFASLRKTLPIPDGAVAWSPRDLPLPEAHPEGPSSGSLVKLAAMLYKRRYLETGETRSQLKSAYLLLQKDGERQLSEENHESISPWSRDLIGRGTPGSWRVCRERNVRALLSQAPAVQGGRPLFSSWPAGHCPFNALYVFDDQIIRDRVRSRMIAAQVYTPVHWPIEEGAEPVVDLSRRLLTIPVDFRCDNRQVARIASLLHDIG
jgi:hypothetical protein